MMKRSAFLLALFLAPAAPIMVAPHAAYAQAASPAAEAQRLTQFLDQQFEEELVLRPQLATRLGRKEGKDRLDDGSEAGQLKALQWRRGSVAKLKAQFDRAKLPAAAQASYDMWVSELERAELRYKFRKYQPPFYSFLYSVHSELPNFMINTHTVTSADDMKAYNARLRAIGPALDDAIVRSRDSTAMGVRAPKFEVERVIAGSRTMIAGAPFADGPDSPLWADAKAKVAKLNLAPAEADALLADTKAALMDLKPAYERVIAWGQGELPKAPSGKVGAISLPNGAAWYAAALKLNTTTDMTAEQIHQKGLSEVSRINAEMDRLAKSAGAADAEAFYAERAKLYPPQPWTDALRAEYLAKSNAVIALSREKLPAFFGLLPAYRAEVVREPSFSEVAGGAAHAGGPSPDGVRPGRVFVHLLGVTDDPAKIDSLMCHEGIPGHVMQGDIQVRQTGNPKFRNAYGYVAFGEGWALYTEALCKEMGVYPDAATDFMRLNAELFRAARLVVDTGIHAKGWTEDQAVDYLIKTTHMGPDQARSEVRRYITLPGQATGYKIGMLKIVELRKRAETTLGPKFDIKGFHDLITSGGSMPLDVLERRVDDWIASRK